MKSLQSATTFFQKVFNASIKAQHALLQMQQKGYLVQEDNSVPLH